MNTFGIMIIFVNIYVNMHSFPSSVNESNNNCRSVDCFRLGWPMRADSDFFRVPIEQHDGNKTEVYNMWVLVHNYSRVHSLFFFFFYRCLTFISFI